ncbi:MAG: hypothetical protein FJ398_26740 [Verrucomicrobia bacterium]|nr:hypothetical protein [Verrucomicrobiota bacterium]
MNLLRTTSSALCFWCVAIASLQAQQTAPVTITVTERGSGKQVPCRIHLKDAGGKPVRAPELPFFRDHFVCPGKVRLELPVGNYTCEIERGPEYSVASGTLQVRERTESDWGFQLSRLADLAGEGWWSGELHVHRPVQDIELLMAAEDLHVAPVITWWNNRNLWATNRPPEKLRVRFGENRFYEVMGGEDEREGGALLFFNLKQPLPITAAQREYPSPMQFLAQARQHAGAWVDIEKPFWWDVPTWLASGQADSIGLANNHMCRDQMYVSEAWGKPRDTQRLPPPRGNGLWTQEIYYHILNCGLRLPPSAGSASGVLPNPVGYNRVYVYLGKKLDYDKWWEGLRAGRSFVSNGPLLRCRANGKLPGSVFSARKGKEVNLEIKAELTTRDPISGLEVVKNGRVEQRVSFEEWRKTGRIGKLRFNESGWFLVRAIADNTNTFRFASTAPFYVEIGEAKRRVSRTSAQFFLDWVRERRQRVKLDNSSQRAEVLAYHEKAEKFWADLLSKANAD